MKWQSKMSEFGLTPETTSISVRRKIADYNDYQETLTLKQNELGTELTEPQKKKVEGEIATLENAILKMDGVLCKDMERLHKHGDRYKQMSNRLPRKQAGAGKKNEPAKPVTPVVPITPDAGKKPDDKTNTAAPADDTKKTTNIKTPSPPAQPGPKQTPAKQTTDPKKKSNIGKWVIGTLVVLGTLGFGGWYFFGRKK